MGNKSKVEEPKVTINNYKSIFILANSPRPKFHSHKLRLKSLKRRYNR